MKPQRRWILCLAALLLAPAWLHAQETGTVVGQVTARATGEPIAGAQILVPGTQIGTLSNASGQYRLANVPAGETRIRVILIGFADQEQRVTVPAGGTATQNFQLEESAISLDAVVVTTTGAQRKREIANAISNIQTAELVETAPITSMSELLNARAPGLQVLQSSGTTGTGARIRIRGSNSVSLSNEPIIFIDGVRVYSAANALSVGTGGQSTSRINDLNPEDIESIEVIKGPSAATLYGTDAANGVIRITTKRGQGGDTRWNLYVEQGTLSDPNTYPFNYRGRTADGENCFAFAVAAGACEQAELVAYQPLEDPVVSPFGTGSRAQYGLNVSGGAENVNYFISGEFEEEVGVLELPDSLRRAVLEEWGQVHEWQDRPNTLQRANLRANVGAQVAPGLNLTLSTGYVNSNTRLPQNDNNALGIVPSGLLGSWNRETPNRGYGFLMPHQVFAIEVLQEIDRFTGSTQANWTPSRWDWLTARATLGLDLTSRHDSRFSPVGEVPFGSSIVGNRSSNRIRVTSSTADINTTARFDLTPEIRSRTSLGLQYYRSLFAGTFAFGQDMAPGSKSLVAAAETQADEQTTESVQFGSYVEQQLNWRDRLYLTGALRADDNSAFGQSLDPVIYPKLGLSYVALDTDSRPLLNLLSSLRLRLAWGASGVAPGTLDAVRFFQSTAATLLTGTAPAVTFGELGNPDLKPERSEEVELGFDAGLIDGRLNLELTWYDKRTEDALIERRLPPSLGVSRDRFENLGSVQNRGIEVGLTGTLVASRTVDWGFNAAFSHNDNKLLDLDPELPREETEPILLGTQRHVEGYPLGGYWDRTMTFEDANDDGIISPGEITLDTIATFIGPSIPERTISLSSGVTLFDLVRLNAQLDHRGNFYQENFTEEFRCRFAICRGVNDPDAPLAEQARGVQTLTFGGSRSTAPYIEKADFWKLREVSLTFFVPDRWASRINAERLNVVLAGRNLATWTDYTGLDPELNQIGQANFAQREFLTQAPVRTFIARVNVGF